MEWIELGKIFILGIVEGITDKDVFYNEFVEKTKSEAITQADVIAEKRQSELSALVEAKENTLKELDEKITNKEVIFEKYFQEAKDNVDKDIKKIIDNQYKMQEELKNTNETLEKTTSALASQERKLEKVKILYRAAENALRMELSIIVQSKHARNFPSPYRIASPHRR